MVAHHLQPPPHHPSATNGPASYWLPFLDLVGAGPKPRNRPHQAHKAKAPVELTHSHRTSPISSKATCSAVHSASCTGRPYILRHLKRRFIFVLGVGDRVSSFLPSFLKISCFLTRDRDSHTEHILNRCLKGRSCSLRGHPSQPGKSPHFYHRTLRGTCIDVIFQKWAQASVGRTTGLDKLNL